MAAQRAIAPDDTPIRPSFYPPIKYQMPYPTCVAESITTILEMLHTVKLGLNEAYEYYSIRYLFGSDLGSYGDIVMNFEDALKRVAKEGVPRWELVDNYYPQRDYKLTSVTTYNDACTLARETNHNDNSYKQRIFLPDRNGIDFYDGPLIDSCLRSGGYVLLGMDTPNSMDRVPSTGIVPDVRNNDWRGDGHAVAIIGKIIINTQSGNKPHWIIVNSWGQEWGDNGFGYIPYDWADGKEYDYTYYDDEGDPHTISLPYIASSHYCFPVYDNSDSISHPQKPIITGARFVENDTQGRRRAEISFTIPDNGCSVLIYAADAEDVLSITDPPERRSLPVGYRVDEDGNVYYSTGIFSETIQYKWWPKGANGATSWGNVYSTSPVTITLDNPNKKYRVSLISVNDTTKVLSLRSAMVDIIGSNIFIYHNGDWVPATPYIYDGSGWKQATAKIFQNEWK